MNINKLIPLVSMFILGCSLTSIEDKSKVSTSSKPVITSTSTMQTTTTPSPIVNKIEELKSIEKFDGKIAFLGYLDSSGKLSDNDPYKEKKLFTEIYTAEGKNPIPKKITNLKSSIGDILWSHNGTKIAFLKEGNIFTIDYYSQEIKQLTNNEKNTSIREIVWSPDDKYIAFTFVNNPTNNKNYATNIETYQINIVSVEKNTIEEIKTNFDTKQYITNLNWSSFDNSIYFRIVGIESRDVYKHDFNKKETSLFFKNILGIFVQGKNFIFLQSQIEENKNSINLNLYDLSNLTTKKLLKSNQLYTPDLSDTRYEGSPEIIFSRSRGPTISPDNKKILFMGITYRESSELNRWFYPYVFDLEKNTLKRIFTKSWKEISNLEYVHTNQNWSPDSNSVVLDMYYSEKRIERFQNLNINTETTEIKTNFDSILGENCNCYSNIIWSDK